MTNFDKSVVSIPVLKSPTNTRECVGAAPHASESLSARRDPMNLAGLLFLDRGGGILSQESTLVCKYV